MRRTEAWRLEARSLAGHFNNNIYLVRPQMDGWLRVHTRGFRTELKEPSGALRRKCLFIFAALVFHVEEALYAMASAEEDGTNEVALSALFRVEITEHFGGQVYMNSNTFPWSGPRWVVGFTGQPRGCAAGHGPVGKSNQSLSSIAPTAYPWKSPQKSVVMEGAGPIGSSRCTVSAPLAGQSCRTRPQRP
jgi:hypothetical protein